jgi:hypothetical protein
VSNDRHNADEVAAWLKGATPKAVRHALGAEIVRQANRLAHAQRAKLAALEQPPAESGGGLASVRVEPGTDGMTQVVAAGGPLTTRDGYDHLLGFEFGTMHQPSRSFFWSTVRALSRSIWAELEKAAGGAIKRESFRNGE